MSQRDGFTGGFLLGSIIGGTIGGILGVLATSRLKDGVKNEEQSTLKNSNEVLNNVDSLEATRRGLEDKIAQLNLAIDDVRDQLGVVNGNAADLD